MRALLNDLADSGLHSLLWLPPLLAGHELGPDFARAGPATKRLVFSSWTMVPRAISVLSSYDAERRYIPDQARAEQYVPRGLAATRDGYALFSWLVPTAALAEAGEPYRYPHGDIAHLLDSIAARLRPRVEALTRKAPAFGPHQNVWYAVAPLLLEGASPDSVRRLYEYAGSRRRSGDAEEADHSVWRDLVANVSGRLAQARVNPSALGRPPDDLVERLALLALSSPANASLRALSRVTRTPTTSNELKREAMRAAWAFRSFFRVSHLGGSPAERVQSFHSRQYASTYLQRVLAYCAEGGLSGVLDEFFHVTLEARGDAGVPGLVAALCARPCSWQQGAWMSLNGPQGVQGYKGKHIPCASTLPVAMQTTRSTSYDPQAGRTRGRCTRRV